MNAVICMVFRKLSEYQQTVLSPVDSLYIVIYEQGRVNINLCRKI